MNGIIHMKPQTQFLVDHKYLINMTIICVIVVREHPWDEQDLCYNEEPCAHAAPHTQNL